MESIAVRGPSEAEYVTGDEVADGMSMPPCSRAILSTILTFTGPGTFTALTPASGTRLAIVSIDATVRNPGAGIVGGFLTIRVSRDGNALAGITADAPGAYTQVAPVVGVTGTAARTVAQQGLLGGQPHVTIEYDGTNPLAQVLSTLGATDQAEIIFRYYPFAEGVSCA